MACADKFARNDLVGGAQILSQIAESASRLEMPSASRRILAACIEEIEQMAMAESVDDERNEYLILTLHTIWVVT